MGAVVRGEASRRWKGTIAFVTVGGSGSYFAQVLSLRLGWALERAGYRFDPVFLAKGAQLDVSHLRRHLSNGIDFAICLINMCEIAKTLDDAGVPYIVLNGYTRDFPRARAVLREDFTGCYDELIRVFKAKKVKSIVEFDYERVMDRHFKAQLFDAGILVRRILAPWRDDSDWRLSDVKACGYRMVASYFADPGTRNHLPDVVVFDDDYLAFGGIAALLDAGLHIPDDIKVVTYSNRGNEPVIGVSLARIENDPVTYASKVADYVIKCLSGRSVRPPKLLWRFRPGTSLS